MPRIRIGKQLELSSANSSVILTDGSNEAGYVPLDLNYFTVGTDLEVKKMAFYNDEEGTDKPVVHSAPLNAPTDPSVDAVLHELFDDYHVYWRWNGATWDKLSEEFRYEFIYVNYSDRGIAAINGTAVIPAAMNNYRLVNICVFNDSSTNIAGGLPIVLKNNVPWGPNQGVAANASNCVPDPTFSAVATGDFLKIDPARMFAAIPVDFAMVLTFKRP